MKKNVIFCMAIAAFTMFFSLSANAGNMPASKANATRSLKVPPADTPYLALVRISYSGAADTPYIQFSILPSLAYSQIEGILSAVTGFFHIEITFLNLQGAIIKEEEYYVEVK